MPRKKTSDAPSKAPRRTLTSVQVAAAIGMGKTSFAKLVATDSLPPSFPEPLLCTPGGPIRHGRRLWLASEVESWLAHGSKRA